MANIPGWPINLFMVGMVLAIVGWYLGCLAWNAGKRWLEQGKGRQLVDSLIVCKYTL